MHFYGSYNSYLFSTSRPSNVTKNVKIEWRTKSCDVLQFCDIFLTEAGRISWLIQSDLPEFDLSRRIVKSEGRCRIRFDTVNVSRLHAMHFLSEYLAR